MAPPDLRFASKWRAAGRSNGPFRWLKRSNIVHHMSLRVPAHIYAYRTALYRLPPPTGINTIGVLASANLECTVGKRAHYRIRTIDDGKFLIFGTGNIILAGKRSHASACVSAGRMARLISKHDAASRTIWPAVHSSPNAVVTGALTAPVSPAIKNETALVNFSNKFPGIALTVTAKSVTPELYLKRGMVIIPGITSSEQLNTVVGEIGSIVSKYLVNDEDAAQSAAHGPV